MTDLRKVENTKNYYANVNLSEIDALTPTSLKILVTIRAFKCSGLPFFVSNTKLAELCRVHPRKISESLAQLRKLGFVEQRTVGNRRRLSEVAWVMEQDPEPDTPAEIGIAENGTPAEIGTAPLPKSAPPHAENGTPIPLIDLKNKDLDYNNKTQEGECRGETKSLHAADAAPAVADATSGHFDYQNTVVVNEQLESESEPKTETQICPTSSISTPVHPKIPTDPQKPHSERPRSPSEQLPVAQKQTKARQPKVLKYTKFSEHDFFWPDHWGAVGRTALAEWVEYKYKTNNPVLQESYQKLINQHAADETGFVADVNFSISSGYKGVFQAPKNIRKSFQTGKVAIDTAEKNKYAAAADWARSLLEDE